MNSNLQPLLENSASEGQKSYDALIAAIDARQPLGQWILPQTTVVWNGTPLGGVEALQQMLAETPATRHASGSLDVHPLPNQNMTVAVSGQVLIGQELPRGASSFGFSLFILWTATPQGFVAQTMTYRLVHKPNDSVLDH